MKTKASRTLMKSAPELWELLDDELALRHWSAQVCGNDGPVEVIGRDSGRMLAWRSDGNQPIAIKVSLEGKGFGTKVEIKAKSDAGLKDGVLDGVLDQLAEPQRRPFTAA
jgi:hypothetical protein